MDPRDTDEDTRRLSDDASRAQAEAMDRAQEQQRRANIEHVLEQPSVVNPPQPQPTTPPLGTEPPRPMESTAPGRDAPLPRPQPEPQPQYSQNPQPQPATQPQPAQPQPQPAPGQQAPQQPQPQMHQPQPQPAPKKRAEPPVEDHPRTDVPEPTLNTPHAPTSNINWGNIIKGALIVTAVVFVAFIGAAFLSGAIGYLVGAAVAVPAVATAVNGTAGVLAPVAHSLNGLVAGAGQWLSGFFGHFAAHLGIGAAATGTAATAATVAPATTHAITTLGVGLGAGAGLAVGVPYAAKHLSTMQMTTPHDAAAPTGMEDGSAAAATTTAKKTVAMNGMGTPGNTLDLPDMPDEMAAAQTTRAGSRGPHGAASQQPAERRSALAALNRSTRASAAWADRETGSNYGKALTETGSHGEAVRSVQGDRPAIKPRDSKFSGQLEQDRVALEAALDAPAAR